MSSHRVSSIWDSYLSLNSTLDDDNKDIDCRSFIALLVKEITYR
jgi:hypothetical protein